MTLLIMANLGYCRLIILRPFKLENEAVGFPGEGLNTKKLASFCGQMEFWAFDVSLNPISNLERLTIIGRLVLELPTMSPMKMKYFQNNIPDTS